MEEGDMSYFGQMVRDGNSDKGTLEWEIELREQTLHRYMKKIFQKGELVNAEVGEYSMFREQQEGQHDRSR